MKVKSFYFIFISLPFLLTSCAQRLVGTWTVQKYENVSPGEKGVSVQNVGSISFDKNGTGQKEMNYTVLGVEKDDSTPFEWSATESYITIKSEDSDISKTWIYLENKNKSQKWKSTDGKNQVQTLELVKQ
ncbi:hypothetical protein SAMN05421636_101362 [Pricia antarctica]|uniref:Lipocalin-like domain-containing protein n=1 Tax=Pricia antarctica TaxID=641691 RepID=A0A1G6WM13_9FLAO|nr:hypothetical protein [Pricia antarctica]SDD66851.1 hypothetical protein SAMN05421636_101362 [Pricia antarctica]